MREKAREIISLARKAQVRLAARWADRLQFATTDQGTTLPQLTPVPAELPDCRSLNGGVVALTLPCTNTGMPFVSLRDRLGNFHDAQVMSVEPLTLEKTVQTSMLPERATRLDLEETDVAAPAVQILLQAPRELFEEAATQVDVHVQLETEHLVFRDVPMTNRHNIEITKFTFQIDRVLVVGRCTENSRDQVSLGVFVDGELSASRAFRTKAGGFSGAIVLGYDHLDGWTHMLELRSLPDMSLLAGSDEFVPLHVTPWCTLQSQARPPLDGALAPAARHHLRAFQLWWAKAALGLDQGEHIPPLSDLYAELIQGFKKRKSYPRLELVEREHPTVSIVMPAHDKFEMTYYCLCSILFAYNNTKFEVIVVDDGSSDETLLIAKFVGGIRVIRNESNRGFVDSCNAGAAVARGEFVALLKNDTEVTAGWLDELVYVFRSFANVGLVGSKLVYPDGRLQEAGGIVRKSGNPSNVGREGNAQDPRYNYLRQVDCVSAAALMLPTTLWRSVGGFSEESAPGYFEDTDLAMKVRKAGRSVVYVPTSTVYRFEGEAAGKSGSSATKQRQEVSRSRFLRKWANIYANHGRERIPPDRDRDRSAAFRVLFVDQQVPRVDNDAGSYAAFQELRLFQYLGAKITHLPRNLAWMDRHTRTLQRIGVECLYSPFVTNFLGYIEAHASEYDVVYVCRYKIAEQVIPLVRASAPDTKVIFNLTDLHYLREHREAMSGTPGYSHQLAESTRRAELAVVRASDLTFSYSEVELAMLQSQLGQETLTAKLPWIVDCKPRANAFASTKDILFVGGFGHSPNRQAVTFFAHEVMPLIRDRLPNVMLDIVGSGADDALSDIHTEFIRIHDHVPDLDDILAGARVFVAPLLAGAGLKGKVLDATSRGLACVLSPIAAEGTGLIDGVDCIVARSPREWANAVTRLYTDEELWGRLGASALKFAGSRYSFEIAATAFREALAKVGILGHKTGGLVYRWARPERYAGD